MRTAESAAIERLAASLTTSDRAKPSAAHTDAARGRLRLAEDALSAARGAAALLADQAHYARHNVSNATAAVRTAALRVIASETLENLIESATTARASYLEAVGSLGWLIRHHAVPERRRAPAPVGARR